MINDNKNLKSLTTDKLLSQRQTVMASAPPLDLLRGSLITRNVKCGKPNCRCASGQGHPSLYFSSFHKNKNSIDYVPAKWEPWVKERLDNYHRLQELIINLSEINLELLRRRIKD